MRVGGKDVMHGGRTEGRTGRMGSNYSISSKGRRERGGDGGFYSLSISGIKEDLRHDGRKGREDGE